MSDGDLSKAVMTALKVRKEMLDSGIPAAEVEQGFQGVVRDVWPFKREWHYLCEHCRDTGLEMFVCKPGARCDGISTRMDSAYDKPGKYQRLCAQFPDADYEHDYGVPCGYCEKGDRFRPKRQQPSDDLDSAASKPKKQFTKLWGR